MTQDNNNAPDYAGHNGAHTVSDILRVAFDNAFAEWERSERIRKAAPDMLAALKIVNTLIAEASMTGFNCHDGDWAEKLFHSQQATSKAIAKAEGRQS